MICPFATYRPISANTGGPMSGHLGLVLHVQQGNGSLYGYFSNPSAQVSAHFWCAKDGTLEQYVDTDTVAWAEANGNGTYLSVETEGFDTEALTLQQESKVADLLAWASETYGFPAVGPVAHGQPGFTPHCNPDGTPDPAWGDHPCPGPIRLGQMTQILSLLHPPPPEQESAMISSTIQFKPGQLDVFQVSAGALWHKWAIAGKWENEAITLPAGFGPVTGAPEVAVIGGACWVTVEDTNGKACAFVQPANSGQWSNQELP